MTQKLKTQIEKLIELSQPQPGSEQEYRQTVDDLRQEVQKAN